MRVTIQELFWQLEGRKRTSLRQRTFGAKVIPHPPTANNNHPPRGSFSTPPHALPLHNLFTRHPPPSTPFSPSTPSVSHDLWVLLQVSALPSNWLVDYNWGCTWWRFNAVHGVVSIHMHLCVSVCADKGNQCVSLVSLQLPDNIL